MPRKRAENQKLYHTTFEVASMLGVSPPTVVNWTNSGALSSHRTPGGHRRIPTGELLAFLKEHEYPIPQELGNPTPAAPVARRSASAPRKVLVVDDDEAFCALVRDWLVLRGGFEVEVASDGFAAGKKVSEFQPQAILLDIRMKGMDGFAVLRTLQEDPKTRPIPVIACTASRDPHTEARVRREPFTGYLEKPFSLELLAQTLEGAITRAASRP